MSAAEVVGTRQWATVTTLQAMAGPARRATLYREILHLQPCTLKKARLQEGISKRSLWRPFWQKQKRFYKSSNGNSPTTSSHLQV